MPRPIESARRCPRGGEQRERIGEILRPEAFDVPHDEEVVRPGVNDGSTTSLNVASPLASANCDAISDE
jgi:hypothetical protein